MEIFRVLRVGERLLMVLRQGHGPSASVGSQVEQVLKILERVGFRHLGYEEHHFGHGGAFLTARR